MLTALPSEGFTGLVPAFPMPPMKRYRWETVDGWKYQVVDEAATKNIRTREMEIWKQAWRTPQACAWSLASWRWPVIAEYCRLKAIIENEPDSNAALVAQLHRFRDQIGLTPAGLKENGWAIAVDEVGAKRTQAPNQTKPPARQRRLRAVD